MILNYFKFSHEGLDYTFFGEEKTHFMRDFRRNKTFYELPFLNFLKELDVTGSYIDGGCFVGNHTIFFSNHCKSTHVYAIDPDLYFHDLWEKNCETNLINKNKVVFLHYALMEKEGYIELNPSKTQPQLSCVDVKDLEVLDEGKLKATTLDKLFSLLDPKEKIALIKLDIEGCELSALKGAIDIIKEHKPIITAEAYTKPEQDAIQAFLYPLNYELLRVFRTGIPMYVFRSKDAS